MEHILREEGLIHSSKVQLQNTSNRIHGVVVLVSCQWILAFYKDKQETRWSIWDLLPTTSCWVKASYPSQKHSWCHWLPPVSQTLWRCLHAADLRTRTGLVTVETQAFPKPVWQDCSDSTLSNQSQQRNSCSWTMTSLQNSAHHGDWWSGCSSPPSEEWLQQSPKWGRAELLPVEEDKTEVQPPKKHTRHVWTSSPYCTC